MQTTSSASPPHDRIDPQMRLQLQELLTFVGPRGFYGINDLHERRARYAAVMQLAAARAPDESRVPRYDTAVARNDRREALSVRVYRPVGPTGPRPGVLYIHGGGMVMGSVLADDPFAAELAEQASCVVVSVEYGLAPEHTGTEPVEDCYDALCWMSEHAADIGVDGQRLSVFGASAGGGLACGAALLAKDRGGPQLLHQMLIYPMLDDRNQTHSSRAIVDLGIWDRDANLEAWRYLLGADAGTDDVSQYAACARAVDLTGLPPTYLDVGDLDLFLDEDLLLAQRLASSGVPVELHVHPGAYHGFDQLAPSSEAAAAARQNRLAALRRAHSSPPPTDSRPEGRYRHGHQT